MAGLLDEEELLPVFSNPNIARQGARARALAARRNVNTLPDPRTYAAVQGLLGTRPDEMGFSVLNPAYEDIRRVADPAFAVGTALGVAPLMGMARFSRPVQQASAASQRGVYLVDTKTKPNPLVGTRYANTQLPGLAPRRPVNYDEMLGGSLMTYPTDMMSRNVLVTNVSEIPLGNNAFVTPGGLPYMRDLQNIANKVGYASNQSAATAQNNRALKAVEENLKRGGTGRVFMAPHTMPRSGENFSTGPTLGLLSMIDATNPSPKLLEMISDQMRSATVKGVKGKYKDFVGLNDPAARLQLLTGEGLSAGSPGDLRKVFVDKMSNVATEKGLDFNYKDLQNAMLDPDVMNKPSFWMGDSIYEALPHLGTRPGSHGAYGFDMPGIFFGNTRGAPISEVMQPVYNRIMPTQMNKPGSGYKTASMQDLFTQIQMPGDIPIGRAYADPNQLTRGKLSTAGEDISLFMDEEQIRRLKRLFGQE